MASRLSPNGSLGRLARTVKNIWTKSEMRRTSQPGSMISAVLSFARQSGRKFSAGGGSADRLSKMPVPRGDKWRTSDSDNTTTPAANARSALRTPLSSAAR